MAIDLIAILCLFVDFQHPSTKSVLVVEPRGNSSVQSRAITPWLNTNVTNAGHTYIHTYMRVRLSSLVRLGFLQHSWMDAFCGHQK